MNAMSAAEALAGRADFEKGIEQGVYPPLYIPHSSYPRMASAPL